MPRDDGSTKTWFVKVDGRVYGPYTAAQMRAYVGEGRVAAHSLVSIEREAGWKPAADVELLRGWLDDARGARQPVAATGQLANFIVIAQTSDNTADPFEAAMGHLGECVKINAGVWLLRAGLNATTLRNELSHLLDRDDRLMVVDASHDRTAWFNLGQETDQKIRDLWGKKPN